MKHSNLQTLPVRLLLWMFFLTSPSWSASCAAEQRIALVLGNGDYAEMPLDNPVNDAGDMARRLNELGFTVVSALNADLREMQQALLEFTALIEPGATALVFYAGHGIQANGRNYLLPVDATLGSEAALKFDAMEVNDILDELDRANTRISVLVLDACRNNPFERKFRGGSRGLAVVDAAAGTLIAYATAPGQVASDGDGRNGLYTSALLEALDTPGLKIEEVFKNVRTEVAGRSQNQQIPWESSSLTGDFVFNPAVEQSINPEGGASSLPIALSTVDREVLFWNEIKGTADPAAFEDYLREYPSGTFAAVARRRVETLTNRCEDLSGEWHVTAEDKACADRMLLEQAADGTYIMNYGICGAMGAITDVKGTGRFVPPSLATSWISFPCNGETVFTFAEGCASGTAKVVRTGGLPGVCQAFVDRSVEMQVSRRAAEQ